MKKKLNLVVDRFEGELVILIDKKGEEIIFPEKYLPKDLEEGDILTFKLSKDKKETQKRRREIKGLIDKLKRKK